MSYGVTEVSVVFKVRLLVGNNKLVVVIVMPHRIKGNDGVPRGRRDGFLTSVKGNVHLFPRLRSEVRVLAL